MSTSPLKSLQDAIRIVAGDEERGRNKRFAQKIGRPNANVSNWLLRDKKAPADACPDIEAATNGQITCRDLRPDIFRAPPTEQAA